MNGVQGDLFSDEERAPPSDAAARAGVGSVPSGLPPVDQRGATEPMEAADTTHVLEELSRWAEAGWIRRLDAAFGRFMVDLDPTASPIVVLAAAMAAHMEGRGHSCLDLAVLVRSSQAMLGWKPDAEPAMSALLQRLPRAVDDWLPALESSRLVAPGGLPTSTGTSTSNLESTTARPLVVSGSRLYLRRYWNYEARVAARVAACVDLRSSGDGLMPVDTGRVRRVLDRLFDDSASALGGVAASADAAPLPSVANSPGLQAAPDWQRIACALALRSRLSIITGGPGTGKTYTVARLLALLFATAPDADRIRVALAAPTGKAAARLKQSIDSALGELEARVGSDLRIRDLTSHLGAARTLHSLLGVQRGSRHFRHGASNPLDVDVLIVDEASMVHLEMMDSILAALPPHARVVLLGDKDQLASVEAGAVLGDLCSGAAEGGYDRATIDLVEAATGQIIPERFRSMDSGGSSALLQSIAMLRTSRRFGGPIGTLATAVNAGDVAAARAVLGDGDQHQVRWSSGATPGAVVALALGRSSAADTLARPAPKPSGYRHYLDILRSDRAAAGAGSVAQAQKARDMLEAFDQFRVLCAVRDGEWGVDGLNAAIEKELAGAGLLKATGEWYEGRPVLVTRNDHAVGVFNGDVGIALAPPGGGGLRVYFMEGEGVRSVMASRLSDVETAFAMTVHKAQGSEFDHTVLVLPDHSSRALSRELVYTGITRARKAFTLVTPTGDVFDQALTQRTLRASGLPAMLAAEEARRRPA